MPILKNQLENLPHSESQSIWGHGCKIWGNTKTSGFVLNLKPWVFSVTPEFLRGSEGRRYTYSKNLSFPSSCLLIFWLVFSFYFILWLWLNFMPFSAQQKPQLLRISPRYSLGVRCRKEDTQKGFSRARWRNYEEWAFPDTLWSFNSLLLKIAIYSGFIWIYPLKIVIFNSTCDKLPEGTSVSNRRPCT